MSFTRFLVIDGLGVLLSVPTSIWLAKLVFDQFGDQIEEAQKKVSHFNHILLAGAALIVVGILLWRWIRRRRAALPVPSDPAPPTNGI
jgi:membrane protein DedA with SNARE-associated domain